MIPVIGCGNIKICVLLIYDHSPMIRKKRECFTCLKEVYVLRPIKAQNMAMSVRYLHRHEKEQMNL